MADNEIRSNESLAPETSQEEKIDSLNENGHYTPPLPIAPIDEPTIANPIVEPRPQEARFTEWTNIDGRITNPIGTTPQPAEPLNQAPPFGQIPYAEPQGYLPNYATPYEQQPYANPNPYAPATPSQGEPIPLRKNKATMWIAIGIIALLLFSSILAIQAAFRSKPVGDAPSLPAPGSAKPISAPSPTELSNSFREIAKTIKPAVVFIRITGESDEESNPLGGFGLPQQRRRQQSAGSGVIVTQDGYIVTNNHVVQKATKIDVTLSDNRKYKATVVGTDPETDLAVIKIDDSGLPTAVLGNSDDVQQGDWVLALGSPFGLQQTLTAGIVSATGREFGGNLGKFIQTDASINPGNSGGPLISMNGEVVGINSFIIPQQLGFNGQGGSLGIGFAVTSNVVRTVFGEIAHNGKVSRGFLGVNPVELDEAKARAYGVDAQSGVLIQNVIPGTPADKAGLRSGDIVTAFEGKKVKTPSELTDAVASTSVGKSCKVDYLREGKPESVTVVLADRTSASRASTNPNPTPSPESPEQVNATKLGVSVQTVTAEIAERLNLKIKNGALVRSISGNSPLGEVLRHGDVIHRIDKFEITSADDLLQTEKSLKPGDDIAIQIERNGQTLILTVTLE